MWCSTGENLDAAGYVSLSPCDHLLGQGAAAIDVHLHEALDVRLHEGLDRQYQVQLVSATTAINIAGEISAIRGSVRGLRRRSCGSQRKGYLDCYVVN